ncbi:MAG TPA: hypothetical protein VGO36_02620 [Solirubrobacterales bacterium]|jgi:hypothetical protein|nr:hypothetical protein [Solirubrobacterales bacterium]
MTAVPDKRGADSDRGRGRRLKCAAVSHYGEVVVEPDPAALALLDADGRLRRD